MAIEENASKTKPTNNTLQCEIINRNIHRATTYANNLSVKDGYSFFRQTWL